MIVAAQWANYMHGFDRLAATDGEPAQATVPAQEVHP
jgi:hypothetical protein